MNSNQSPHKNELTEQDQRSLDVLFDRAKQAEQEQSVAISKDETKAAYQSIAPKIQKAQLHHYWHYAAAAVALIGLIGLGFALTPRTLTIANGQTKTIQLNGGTTITLNSGSTLSYPRWFSLWERSVSLEGEAYFEVSHNGKPFKVKTPNALVTVMGTSFNVRAWSNEPQVQTHVFLKEGKVALEPRDNPHEKVILSPGQSSAVIGNDQPVSPEKANAKKAIAWLQNGLAFDNQPLAVIFDEISRRYAIQIRVQNERLLKEKLTIYISDMKGAEQTLADICRVKNLDYTKQDRTFIITNAQ